MKPEVAGGNAAVRLLITRSFAAFCAFEIDVGLAEVSASPILPELGEVVGSIVYEGEMRKLEAVEFILWNITYIYIYIYDTRVEF